MFLEQQIPRLSDDFKLLPIVLEIPSIKITNPSIVRIDEGYLLTCHEYSPIKVHETDETYTGGDNFLFQLNEDLSIKSYHRLDDSIIRSECPEARNGLEDGRIFKWGDQLKILFSAFHKEGKVFKNTMLLCTLDGHKLCDPVVLKSPRGQSREKNWMPLISDSGELFFIYSTFPLKIFQVINHQLQLVKEMPSRFKGLLMSGSSQAIDYDSGYLMVLHQRRRIPLLKGLIQKYITKNPRYQSEKIRYLHYLVKMNKDFQITKISKPFIFEALGIEFCAGIAKTNSGLAISYGFKDQQAKLITMPNHLVTSLLA